MKNINFENIRRDLVGDKRELYKEKFPHLIDLINEFVKTPFNNVVNKQLSEQLENSESSMSLMSEIYEEDVNVEYEYKFEVKNYEQKSVVFEVPVSEYKEWFVEYTKVNCFRQVKTFSTVFNETNDTIIFSAIVLER
jgi:hypothetical protein